MFNVTVLKMKDIVRYMLSLIIVIILFIFISKQMKSTGQKEKKEQAKMPNITFGSLISCLDKTLPSVSVEKENEKIAENINEKKYLEEFLKTEISTLKAIEETEKAIHDNGEEELDKKEEQVTLAGTENIKSEVVTPNPIAENFNVQYNKVKIKNQTSYTLTDDILKPDITIENKNVLIFHTHSCESYTASEKYPYTPSGNYRCTDLSYTVTRVGTELENYLKQYNLNVSHSTAYHDYPAYNGSYTRSLATVENMLKENQSDIIIDLHRDAIGSREDYAPSVKIGEDVCAQIMFVIRNE